MDLLLVDDSPTDRLVMKANMQRAFPGVQVSIAGEASELNDALRRENCDVVITDYWLGWGDGLSVLQRVRKRWPRCRVIFLTGNGGEEVVAEAFRFGLFYYLLKPDGFDKLVPVTRMALESKRREDDHELIAAVVGAAGDAVFSVDPKGTVTTWNRGAERMFAVASADMIGKEIDLIVPPELRAAGRRRRMRVLKGETIAPFAATCQRADGSKLSVELSMAPIAIDERAISGIACIARESRSSRRRAITERWPVQPAGAEPAR
jgi:PAS domain S-box-containing protein